MPLPPIALLTLALPDLTHTSITLALLTLGLAHPCLPLPLPLPSPCPHPPLAKGVITTHHLNCYLFGCIRKLIQLFFIFLCMTTFFKIIYYIII